MKKLSSILKENQAKIEEKTLWKNDWFQVVEKTDTDGASMTGLKANGGNVVVLPYVKENGKITKVGVMYEVNPLWGEGQHATTVTGGIEEGEDNLEAAKRELKEESGYDVPDSDKWEFICEVNVSKLIDGKQPCFAVDITGVEQGEATKDGTINESLSDFKLLDTKEAINTVKDAYVGMILLKLIVNEPKEDEEED